MPTGIYKRTEEHNNNIQKALLGRVISAEWKKKIGNANKGKKHSIETRKKISERLLR